MTAGALGHIEIRGPLRRSDLPGLYARVCRALAWYHDRAIVCDVRGIAPDAVAVEALCRLQLAAGRHGATVAMRGASPPLRRLVALCGLDDVLREELVEARWQAEEREEALGVEEERDLLDSRRRELDDLE